MSQTKRYSALLGVVFAALMLVALNLDNTPSSKHPNQWASYFSSHSNQVRTVVISYLWVLAGIALVGFLLVLRDRMQGRMTGFTLITGAIAAGGFCITGGLYGTVGGTVLFGDSPTPIGQVAEFVASTAYPVLLVASMLPLAACLISLGVTVVQERSLPVWMGWFTGVMGVILLVSVLFIPLLAAVLFGLVLGIALTVRPGPSIPAIPDTVPADRAPVA